MPSKNDVRVKVEFSPDRNPGNLSLPYSGITNSDLEDWTRDAFELIKPTKPSASPIEYFKTAIFSVADLNMILDEDPAFLAFTHVYNLNQQNTRQSNVLAIGINGAGIPIVEEDRMFISSSPNIPIYKNSSFDFKNKSLLIVGEEKIDCSKATQHGPSRSSANFPEWADQFELNKAIIDYKRKDPRDEDLTTLEIFFPTKTLKSRTNLLNSSWKIIALVPLILHFENKYFNPAFSGNFITYALIPLKEKNKIVSYTVDGRQNLILASGIGYPPRWPQPTSNIQLTQTELNI